MSSQYTATAANALRMISEKGRSITVLSPPPPDPEEQVYDPMTDVFSGDDPVETPAKGVFTSYAAKDIDGELIHRSDKKLLIAAAGLSFMPNTEHSIRDGNDEYEIMQVDVVQPGDTPILYIVQVRR